MSLRAGNYSYGGSGSSSKNQFYGTGNYSLPYPFDLRMLHDNAGPVNKDDLHELRQAEYGAILSPLQQAALPSAYSNSVLSKTLENIGRSTGSYSAATANANASTALTATGTLKPMGASKKEKLHSQNTSRTFISFLSAVGSDDSFFLSILFPLF